MDIEVGELYTPWGVKENVKIKLGKRKGSLWFASGVYPGFVDAHAHPQVVDSGADGRKWSNYLEWFHNRKLRVDEASLRRDLELCTRLSKLTLMLSALEGATLIALTGNYKANLRAAMELRVRPRVVIMPTIIERKGWYPINKVMPVVRFVEMFDSSDTLQLGVFCHSLRFTNPEHIRYCFQVAESNGLIFGLHLSEGVKELGEFKRIVGVPRRSHVVGVHCIEDEDYTSCRIRVVQCLRSNLALYGRSKKDLSQVHAFGSDWPLIHGGILSELEEVVRYYGWRALEQVVQRASLRGYDLFRASHSGDFVFFDQSLSKCLSNRSLPKYVFVGGEPVVVEGTILGLTRRDVWKLIEKARKEAIEKHPADGANT